MVSFHLPFKAYLLRDAPTGLTFNNCTLCPHCIYVFFLFIWEQTATCATYSINWLVFITEMKRVYCAVRTGSLSKAVCASCLKGSSRLWLYTELRTVAVHWAMNWGCTLSYEQWVYTELRNVGVHWAMNWGCTLSYELWVYTELWTAGVQWATNCGCSLSYELWVYTELWTVGVHWAKNCGCTLIYEL